MTRVEITPDGGDSGYRATVDGVPLTVAAYVVEPGGVGGSRAMVSLIVAADQVQIGGPAQHAADRPLERRNERPTSTWGAPGQPDPRANIPGWQPPPAAADSARNVAGRLA